MDSEPSLALRPSPEGSEHDRCASAVTKVNRVPFRGGGFAPRTIPAVSWAGLGLIIGLWQASSSFHWISPTFLPGPLAIFAALRELALSGELWKDASASLLRIAAGWSIGAAVGLIVGVAMGLFSVARSVAAPTISSLYPIPKIALLPLFILWLGVGELSKVVIIALGVFFPTAITTYTSIDSVPRNLIRMSQSFGVPLRAIVLKTLLPGSCPGILAGVRISVASALLLMVSAEMIGAQNGLGAFMLLAGNLMRTDQLLAGVVILSALGIGIGLAISLLEKGAFKWR